MDPNEEINSIISIIFSRNGAAKTRHHRAEASHQPGQCRFFADATWEEHFCATDLPGRSAAENDPNPWCFKGKRKGHYIIYKIKSLRLSKIYKIYVKAYNFNPRPQTFISDLKNSTAFQDVEQPVTLISA